MTLPSFRYHRDPLMSGSVSVSEAACRCCGEARGYVYGGPVYAAEDLQDSICPWCIANGSAHAMFDAEFVDSAALSEDLPREVVEEVSWRTPGYHAWQQEQWPACCGDAMMFLEPLGIAEIRARYPELEFVVLGNIIYDLHVSGGAATRMLESLNRDSGPTAYVFQCGKCGRHRTFVDGIFGVE